MSVVLVKFGEIVFGILLKLDLQKTISYLFSTNSYKDNSSITFVANFGNDWFSDRVLIYFYLKWFQYMNHGDRKAIK